MENKEAEGINGLMHGSQQVSKQKLDELLQPRTSRCLLIIQPASQPSSSSKDEGI